MMASSSACTPLFLNAVPHMHSDDLVADRTHAQALADLIIRELTTFQVLVGERFVGLGRRLDHLGAVFVGLFQERRGISWYSNFIPWVAMSQ